MSVAAMKPPAVNPQLVAPGAVYEMDDCHALVVDVWYDPVF
jgi:hypothetical protein